MGVRVAVREYNRGGQACVGEKNQGAMMRTQKKMKEKNQGRIISSVVLEG